jgi:PBSX family phage terminase large subunit
VTGVLSPWEYAALSFEREAKREWRGAARELLATTAMQVCITGPAGTGKTLAALWKMHLTCLNTAGVQGLMLRQTHLSLTATTLVSFERNIATEALATGSVVWFGGSGRQPPAYRYPGTGSTILVGGLDKPAKFLSAELDLVFVDEATEISLTALETMITRLRGSAPVAKQIILACNPDRPTHWIKKRCDDDAMTMLVSRHADNPAYVNPDGTLTPAGAEYLPKLDALTGVRRLRLRDGIWAAAEGLIYEDFDERANLTDRFPIPPAWMRIWSVDFGFVNPFVAQCWAVDPDGRLWLEWEVYRTQRLVEDHAITILDQVTKPDPGYRHPAGAPRYAYHGRTWTGPKPRAVICDHDAEDRATLERHLGMSTASAKKTVSDGIQAVQARLRPAGDGRPRLVLLRDAVVERDRELADSGRPASTAEEFPGYVWNIGVDKRRDEPVKVDDHGMDACRYAVAHFDLGGRPRMRWM